MTIIIIVGNNQPDAIQDTSVIWNCQNKTRGCFSPYNDCSFVEIKQCLKPSARVYVSYLYDNPIQRNKYLYIICENDVDYLVVQHEELVKTEWIKTGAEYRPEFEMKSVNDYETDRQPGDPGWQGALIHF